jgi:hypothetical protein
MSAREQAGLRPGEPDLNAAPAGIDTRDMLLIHRVIRREIGRLPGLFRTAGEPARAARITAHASEMLDFLPVHHTGEDELLWPALRRRVRLDGGTGARERGLCAATCGSDTGCGGRHCPGWRGHASPHDSPHHDENEQLTGMTHTRPTLTLS